jgi:hypothetical protein
MRGREWLDQGQARIHLRFKMPIRPELRKFYGAHWRQVVRPKILRRAGGRFEKGTKRYLGFAKCEQCGAVDGGFVIRHPDWPGCWFEFPSGIARDFDGRQRKRIKHLPADLLSQKLIPVQIGVAHLNNVAGDDRPENLAALCRGCHLRRDETHHFISRANRKDSSRPLLAALRNTQ